MNKKVIFFIILFFLNIFFICGDTRSQNIDVYLVLDKSLSMVEEIDSVKEYVEEKIVNEILMPGDRFTLILFYGEAIVSYNGTISSNDGKKIILEKVESIEADGHFTDIGNALDKLGSELKDNTGNRRKYLLLITDGKQEAPPDSKYYSPDHSFNHEFLKNVKIIQKKGWKIEILGIGVNSAAKELAEKLSGSYAEVSDNADAQEISRSIGNFLGIVEVENPPSVGKITKTGASEIELSLICKDYDSAVTLSIKQILLTSRFDREVNILNSPFTVSIQPDKVRKIVLPVTFPIHNESYKGEISFVFSKGASFSPAVHEITVPKVVNNTILIYSIIAGLLIIVIAIFIIRTRKPVYKEDDNKKEALKQ